MPITYANVRLMNDVSMTLGASFTFRHENKAQQHALYSDSEFIRVDNVNLGNRFRKILPIVGQEDIRPCRYSGRKMGGIRSAQAV